MALSLLTVLIWKYNIQSVTKVDSIMPGFFVSLVSFFLLSYFLADSTNKKKSFSSRIELDDSKKTSTIESIKSFSLYKYCNSHLPKSSSNMYMYFGMAIYLTLIINFTYDKSIYQEHVFLINALQVSILAIGVFFLYNVFWLQNMEGNKYLGIIWFCTVFTSLAFISSLMVLISKLTHASLIVLTIHLAIIPMLVGWRAGIIMIIIGLGLSFSLYINFVDTISTSEIYNYQLKLLYIVLMIMGFSVTFIREKQEKEVKIEKKVAIYAERINDQEEEIARLASTAEKILNNVNHELRLPVGNVRNFSEMIKEGLGKYSKEQLEMLSSELYQNSNRLSSMILNMLDLAMLDTRQVKLKKSKIDFSKLVEERINNCRHVYTESYEIEFEVEIEHNISIEIDPNYMRQVIDNLIINAMKHSTEGPITIKLKKSKQVISFAISNVGDKIPHRELYDIFRAFKMSSKTEKKNEGRGIGLTLCKAAIEAHKGMITAENHDNGARFRFTLPL